MVGEIKLVKRDSFTGCNEKTDMRSVGVGYEKKIGGSLKCAIIRLS
jgi:hypothetical protein